MPPWLIVVFVVLAIGLLIACFPELIAIPLILALVLLVHQGGSALLTLASNQELQVVYIIRGIDESGDDLRVRATLPANWSRHRQETISFETLEAPASVISDTMTISLQGIASLDIPTSTLELPLQPASVVTQTAVYRPGWFSGPTAYVQARMSTDGSAIVTRIPVHAYGDWR
jgi:hypothetical protein